MTRTMMFKNAMMSINHFTFFLQPVVVLISASKIQLSSSREATLRLRLACTAFKSSDARSD